MGRAVTITRREFNAADRFCCKLGEQVERFLGRTEIQAAMSNKLAMKAAWAFMSRPSILRTCPFLIMRLSEISCSG
ncbi:conserved protein of unknown function (plasmid) [Rhodovastum atsumiense]|uniref:Uncharacterized protein n=1 Tax=Rhodovastum atsumiense TaxID=504468 RepID=A0A5M6ILD5_9PROT|nr:hypothetical protein [Rhodovastum atsumiense]KAA5608435.1 hypothetical protein F1189_29145 [Rhodovastum atsumiense]CAH2605721.1 conserved protein of unknown function [Rhodovastum atsumiense]